MSSYITHTAEGIERLVIEELARDAHIRGLADGTEISVQRVGERQTPEFIRDGDTLYVRAAPVGRIMLPTGLALTVRAAAGDLRLQDTTGDILLEQVSGDLRLAGLEGVVRVGVVNGGLRADVVADLRLAGACNGDVRLQHCGVANASTIAGDLRLDRCGNVRIEHVRGDVWAENLQGTLEIMQADGDVRLNGVTGIAMLGSVHGDLRALALGGLTAPAVNGDVDLQGPFGPEQPYQVSANGDAHVRIQGDADLRLLVTATGRIRSDLQLIPARDGTPSYSAVLGRGAGQLTVRCQGDVRIGGEAAGAAYGNIHSLGDRIREQVSASLASAGINIETGEIDLGQRGSRKGRMGREGRPPVPPRPWAAPAPARPPTGERPPAGNAPKSAAEEYLAILRMVENGTITAEEAEALLRALGA